MGRMCGAKAPKTPSLVILGLSDSSDTIYTSQTAASGRETTWVRTTRLSVPMSDIVNYSPQPQKLWLAVEYEYLPGQAEGYLDAELQFVSVDPCSRNSTGDGVTLDGTGQFLVPHDKAVALKSDNFVIAKDGILVNGRKFLLASLPRLTDVGCNSWSFA